MDALQSDARSKMFTVCYTAVESESEGILGGVGVEVGKNLPTQTSV
jgi:hypothetical protein